MLLAVDDRRLVFPPQLHLRVLARLAEVGESKLGVSEVVVLHARSVVGERELPVSLLEPFLSGEAVLRPVVLRVLNLLLQPNYRELNAIECSSPPAGDYV